MHLSAGTGNGTFRRFEPLRYSEKKWPLSELGHPDLKAQVSHGALQNRHTCTVRAPASIFSPFSAAFAENKTDNLEVLFPQCVRWSSTTAGSPWQRPRAEAEGGGGAQRDDSAHQLSWVPDVLGR